MTDFLVMPDLEAVVRKAIADAGFRAYTSIPNSPVWPLSVVHRGGGFPAERRYLDAARIQIDVWGSARGDVTPVPKSQLHDEAQNVRVAVLRLEGRKVTFTGGGAFVSGVEDGPGLQWLPDDETGRERYLMTMIVYGRSLLTGE